MLYCYSFTPFLNLYYKWSCCFISPLFILSLDFKLICIVFVTACTVAFFLILIPLNLNRIFTIPFFWQFVFLYLSIFVYTLLQVQLIRFMCNYQGHILRAVRQFINQQCYHGKHKINGNSAFNQTYRSCHCSIHQALPS